MIQFLIRLFGGSWIRAAIAGAVVLSTIAGGWAVYHAVYERGYNKAVSEYQAQRLQEIERAVAEARKKWEESAEVARIVLERERDITETTNALNKKIPGAVASSPCNRVGPDVLRLLNNAILAADPRGDAPSPAGSASRVP